MQIAVAYADPLHQVWLRIEVPEETTVEEAIVRSGILRQFPAIDLTTQKVGVFGKVVSLDSLVRAGDRVEIYRTLVADPKTVPRRRGAEDDED